MTQVLLALLLIPSATRAQSLSGDLALCARIGAQSQVAGRSQVQSRRDVRFQLCTSDGDAEAHPVMGVVQLELRIDGAPNRIISTDSAGRFYLSYVGGLSTTRELHSFVLDGEVIATFLVERSPASLDFTRSKNLQDQEASQDYP